jgi:hypothetical protein
MERSLANLSIFCNDKDMSYLFVSEILEESQLGEIEGCL